MTSRAPTTSSMAADLSAPASSFALDTVEVAGASMRVFRSAPQTLCDAYLTIPGYDDRILSVFEGSRITYRETLGKAAALASFLRNNGLAQRGSRVGIAMHNCPEWMVAFIAVTALGATAVLINNRGTTVEMTAALEEAATDVVIADEPCARRLLKTGGALSLIVHGYFASRMASPGISFAEAIVGWEAAELQPIPVEPDDEALIMFTSGTTGSSKGVLLTHRGVLTGVMNIQYSMSVIGARIRAERGFPAASQAQTPPVALLAVPLFHTSGCYSIFLSNLLRGGKIVMLRKWHVERALDLIERERVSAFSGPPSMLWDLVQARREGRDLDSLTSIGVAGQDLRQQLLRDIAAAFPRAVVGRGYGMTEANGSVCLIAGDELLRRPSSSGQVIATADIRIIDDGGREVACGDLGEICLRGAMVMRGYCRQTQETAAALRDGWLHTGDLGRLDADGHLHVLDRKKNIIICGGDKISCGEVERVVLEHPAVMDAAVFGVADDRLGEIPSVAVVLKPDCLIDAFALKNHVATQLAIYKVPRLVMYSTTLPRNALGKINRRELRRQFMALHPRYRVNTGDIALLPVSHRVRKQK